MSQHSLALVEDQPDLRIEELEACYQKLKGFLRVVRFRWAEKWRPDTRGLGTRGIGRLDQYKVKYGLDNEARPFMWNLHKTSGSVFALIWAPNETRLKMPTFTEFLDLHEGNK
jgi:hypothetical protein